MLYLFHGNFSIKGVPAIAVSTPRRSSETTKTKWGSFVHRKKYTTENILPIFLTSSDKYVQGIGQQIRDCGNFVRLAECNVCSEQYFNGFNRCRSKFCPSCEHTKSMLWFSRLMQTVQPIIEDYEFYNLNLTITSQSDLTHMLNILENAWRYMKNGHKEYRKRFKQRFIGGVRSLEVKRGKGGYGWHAHFHCFLIATKTYQKDFDWIKEAWSHSTGGLAQSVYLKKINKRKIINGILEQTKYIVKLDIAYDSAFITELVYSLRNKRRINAFGILYGLGRKVDQDFDRLDTKEKTLEGFLCEICGSQSASIIIKHFDDIENNYYKDLILKGE